MDVILGLNKPFPIIRNPIQYIKTKAFRLPSMRGPKSLPKHLAQQPDTLSNDPPVPITGEINPHSISSIQSHGLQYSMTSPFARDDVKNKTSKARIP
jgi:hypothetical protein